MARQPGIALGASVLIAGMTLLASAANFGKPLGWPVLVMLFFGGLASGMGIAKAKREWHDAWVRQTFTDVVIGAPREDSDPEPEFAYSHSDDESGDELSEPDLVLRAPRDGPDSDVILSLPHGREAGVPRGLE